MRDIFDRSPEGLDDMLLHVLDRFSTMDKVSIADLNTMLVWTTCAFRPLTLAELDFAISRASPKGRINGLEEKIRGYYASFFTLHRADGKTTEQRRKEGHIYLGMLDDKDEPEIEILRPLSQEVGSEPSNVTHKRGEVDRRYGFDMDDDFDIQTNVDLGSNPFTTTVSLSHASWRDFFHSHMNSGTPSTEFGINIDRACFNVLDQCLDILCDKSAQDLAGQSKLRNYAAKYSFQHLDELFTTSDPTESRVITEHFYRISTDEAVISRWLQEMPDIQDIRLDSILDSRYAQYIQWWIIDKRITIRYYLRYVSGSIS